MPRPDSVRRRSPLASVTGTLAALVGLWLVLSPFALGFGPTALWSQLYTGVLVVAFGTMLALAGARSLGLSVLLAAAGLWLIIASAVLRTGPAASWNLLMCGAFLAMLAVTSTAPVGTRRSAPS